MTPSDRTITRVWPWLLLVSLPTIGLTVYLLAIGEPGVSIAAVLAVPIGIGSIVVPLVVSRIQTPQQVHALSGRAKAWIAGGIIAIAVLPFAIWWGYSRYADVDVDLGAPFQLSQTNPHILTAHVDRPPWRGDLEFVVHLTSGDKTRNCVPPALMRFTAIADKRSIEYPKLVRNDGRVSIPIPKGTDEVQVLTEYLDPGPQKCVVTAVLIEGTLSR